MASRAEIMEALRAADAAGDTAAAERLAAMYDAAPVDEPGLGDNFARAGQTLDDSMRILADTGTRGYLDKFLGPEQQALTEAARQRQGWGGTALDVGSAVVTSPYRVGSTLAGGGFGAIEGMASEYGHQDDWIPSPGEAMDIGRAGVKGAAFGSGGAKAGEIVGDAFSRRAAKADQPYPTDDSLRTAASDAERQVPDSPRTLDLQGRVNRVEAARAAQGQGRDAFATMRAGMTPDEIYKASDIAAKPKSMTAQAGGLADSVGKNVSIPMMVTEAVMGGGIPWNTLAGVGAKAAIGKAGRSPWANRVPEREVEDLAALIRDPRGIGLQPDSSIVDKWRGLFAKAASGAGR